VSKKLERQERNKDKSGVNVQLLARVNVLTVPDDWGSMTNDERGGYLDDPSVSDREACVGYIPAASENEGIRTVRDAKDWMGESDFIGTVMAVARRNWGAERTGQMTRAKQEVVVIT